MARLSNNKPRTYRAALGIRGDMLYCPLPLQIDPYWTCEPNCAQCSFRALNRAWGQDFRAADPDAIRKRLSNPKPGKSPLQQAIRQRKSLRLGSRSDPFQPCEREYRVTTRIVEILRELDWDTVVQTKFPNTALELTGGLGPNFTLVVELTVGLERDWELLEHKKTEHPMDRLKAARRAQREFGLQVGALGEPFIPGYHTIAEFEDAIKLLKEYGINRFNVYNLHFNDLVAKNFAELGLDIEKIWTLNQDKYWRRILRRLLQVADRYGIILGCPDFVNSGWGNVQRCNTCCGVDVKNPCTWNTHYFKLALQQGKNPLDCWDGVGDYDLGMAVIQGTAEGLYTIKDII